MTRSRDPFASRVQTLLIVLLLVCFMLVGQRFSLTIYTYGLMAMMGLTIVQIALGNTDPRAGPGKTLRNLVITFLIVGGVIIASLYLAPTLIGFGR